jgi:protein TonB
MRLNRNIMLSLVMHASLILAVMTAAVGKNAASGRHEKYLSVTLFENSVAINSVEPPPDKRKTEAGTGAPPPARRLEKPSRAPAVLQAPKEAVTSAVLVDKEPAALPIKPAGETSGAEGVKAASVGENEVSAAGEMSVSLIEGTEVSGSRQERGRTGDGDAALIGVIRGAIQRALIYPAAARRRGFEGTVVAEFRINGQGLPEGLRITKSSGHGLLDKAARETIIRAAPMPPVKGKIEIPITFKLTEAD